MKTGLVFATLSSDMAQHKTLSCFSCLQCWGTFHLRTMAIIAKSHFLHLNNEGLHGEEHQDPLEPFCQQRQMFCVPCCPPWKPKTPKAFPKEVASWGRRESQVQHRTWVTNSGQRRYQFLEKEEKKHLQTKKMASIGSVQQKNQLLQELKCLSTHITSKARMQGGQSSSG